MTSPFERLPHEVLENIIAYLSYSRSDLHQLQRTCKRCQYLAEKHLFERLVLYSPASAQYKPLLGKPQRCSFVKTLRLTGTRRIELGTRFFSKFKNIEAVYCSCTYKADWFKFRMTFAPERCKLKEIPQYQDTNVADEADMRDYCAIIQDHSGTLEKLDLDRGNKSICLRLIKLANSLCNFPKLKHLSFFWASPKLQDLDAMLDKYPLLERFKMVLAVEDSVDTWIPTRQHQRIMKEVHIHSYAHTITSLATTCTYIAARFPNVQDWYTSGIFLSTQDEQAAINQFEKDASSLHLAMKAMKVAACSILARVWSVSKFLELFKQYGVTKHLKISFGDLSISWSSPLECEVSMYLMRSSEEYCGVKLLFGTDIAAPLLAFLEKSGHYIQTLELDFPEYSDEEDDSSLHGGTLAKVLDCCPSLTKLKCKAIALNSRSLSESKTINRSLKTMSLKCDTIDENVLHDISQAAPNITHLSIESDFGQLGHPETHNRTRKLIVDMPENNLNKLGLIHTGFWDSKSDILLQIISSVPPEERYYIQKLSEGKRETPASISKKEFEDYCGPHTEMLIYCRSINYIQFTISDDCFEPIPFHVFQLQL